MVKITKVMIMKPPVPFNWKKTPKHYYSFSLCRACDKYVFKINIFHHEGRDWRLCYTDYEDYWYNTDELLDDYEGYVT